MRKSSSRVIDSHFHHIYKLVNHIYSIVNHNAIPTIFIFAYNTNSAAKNFSYERNSWRDRWWSFAYFSYPTFDLVFP